MTGPERTASPVWPSWSPCPRGWRTRTILASERGDRSGGNFGGQEFGTRHPSGIYDTIITIAIIIDINH